MIRTIGIGLVRGLERETPPALSRVRARLRREAIDLIRSEELVSAAAYSYNIVPLQRPADVRLHAGGEVLEAPRLLPERGELTALACGVCTLGPQLEARTTSLFAQRRASLALTLDELGNEMLFTLGRRMQDRMLAETQRQGLTMSGELNAGDPGLPLDAQAAVLRLAEGCGIGVALYRDRLLTPLKSSSMVLGVGKNLPATTWSRCDECPSRKRCGLARRRQRDAATAGRIA